MPKEIVVRPLSFDGRVAMRGLAFFPCGRVLRVAIYGVFVSLVVVNAGGPVETVLMLEVSMKMES